MVNEEIKRIVVVASVISFVIGLILGAIFTYYSVMRAVDNALEEYPVHLNTDYFEALNTCFLDHYENCTANLKIDRDAPQGEIYSNGR